MKPPLRALGAFCLLCTLWLLRAGAATTAVPLSQEQFRVSGSVTYSIPLPNGQLLIAGEFESINGLRQPRLARLNADGTLDQSWHPQLSDEVTAMVVDGDYVYIIASIKVLRVKLSGDGQVDNDWQPPFDTALNFSESPDDIAAGGGFVYLVFSQEKYSDTSLDHSKYVLRRYFQAGQGKLDRSWTTKTIDVGDAIVRLALDGEHLYVAHDLYRHGTYQPTHLERYSLRGAGARDPHWKFTVPHPDGFVGPLAQDSKYVYLAGKQMRVGRTSPVNAVRISKLTARSDLKWPDLSLAGGGSIQYDVAVAGGVAYFASQTGVSGVPTGPDNPTGQVTFSLPLADNPYLSLSATDNEVYLMASSRGTTDELLRFDSQAGSQDRNYRPGISESASISQVLRLPDGTVYVAGLFSSVGDVKVNNLVRFAPDGHLDEAWIPKFPPTIGSPDELGIAGEFIYFSGPTPGRVSLAAPARVDTNWAPFLKLQAELDANHFGFIDDAVFGPDGLYLLFAVIDRKDIFGTPTDFLRKIPFSGDGTPDPAWKVDVGFSGGLFLHQGYLYVGGFTGHRYPLTTPVTPDPNWQVKDPYTSLFAADDTYIYQASSFDADLKRYPLAGNGTADPAWAPNFTVAGGKATLNSLLLVNSRLYVSGRFDAVGGAPHLNVARLDNTGSADASFTTSVPYVDSTLPGANGAQWVGVFGTNPVLGGVFAEIDGAPAFPPSILNALTPPVLTHAGTKVFAQSPDAASVGIAYFRVTALVGGILASNGTPLASGNFISLDAGSAGLDFMPDPNFTGSRSVSLASASTANAADTGATSSTIDLTDTSVPKNRYSMAATAITVREGSPSALVTVQKIGPQAGRVTFMLEEGSARVGASFAVPASLTVDFPTGDGTAMIAVPLIDDLVFTGNKDFRVVLTESADGGLLLSPSATLVTILDDDPLGDTASLTTLPALPGLPLGNASLTVTLNAPLGAWRLLGEANWHSGGATLPGLTRGNYFVEFRLTNGFIAPQARTVPVDFGESVSIDGAYLPLGSTAMGALAVSIQPASVANDQGAARGQWRLVGETDWRDSDATVENLAAGPYDVEFKPVAGRATPPPQTVNVAGSVLYTIVGTYLIAEAGSGAAPAPVDFSTLQTVPYALVGQIRTAVGFASGTAVRDRVVLTVSHALFDDATLSSVTDVLWFHQKARGDFEPPPQQARGWYIFDGYASQRATDLGSSAGAIGISTPDSQKLDVAALWFLEPCARGSFAGYLRTDAQNDFLLAARRRILAGYPVENVAEEEKGVLHATDPDVSSTFTAVNDVVRSTADLRGFGGMSGGPLFVEENGAFYPAGVFLGGTAQCLVRVIDSGAVDLINRGEFSGNGGENNVGGGISLVAPGVTTSPYAPTLLGCTLSPAAVIPQGAAWRIAGEQNYRPSGTRVAVKPGTYRLEFNPVAGYVAPDPQVLTLVQGQAATSRNTYVPGAFVQVTIQPDGAGSAPSGYYALGEMGSVKATPASNYLFDAWMENGAVLSRNQTLTFDVNGPRTFVATFREGTFVPYAGGYAGLHESAGTADGIVSFTVTGTGSFSGKVTYRGKTYQVHGTLDEAGAFSGALGPYPLLLQLDRSSPVGALTGQIFDGSTPTAFTATQSPYSTTAATTLAGSYTLLLPSADPSDSSKPPGTGFAKITVTAVGAVSFTGTLADGVPISGSGQLIDGDYFPIYAATFKGLGSLSGQLHFHKVVGQSDADGPLRYVRPPAAPDKYYPAGFETTLPAIASSYVAPPVDYSTATLKLKGGGLASEVTRALSINNSTFVVTSSEDSALRFTIDRKTGLISGTLTSPATNKKLPIGGAAFQTSRRAAGYFKAPAPATGALEIVPGP